MFQTRHGKSAFIACLLGIHLAATPAFSQSGTKIEDHPDNSPSAKTVTMAVLPWHFEKGTKGAISTAKEYLAEILTKARIETVSEAKILTVWEEVTGEPWREDKTDRPSPQQLLHLGQKLGVDWVMVGNALWHSRSIWIGLGPKTKSNCTVDAMIVNVQTQEVALDARGVTMDDTAKEDTLKVLGALFVSYWITVASGGPKTPHEQRAVELAMTKALEPWLVQYTRVTKIDPAKKSN